MPVRKLLETPPPAARPSRRQRSRFGRLGGQPSPDRFSDDLAMLDDVTGLRDSRCLWKELAQRAARCSETSPLAVVVLDFDRLADVNDHYDRSVGDAVLRRCAKVTGEEAPSARLAFRYRDDELVVLVPGDEEDGREVAERIRARIAAQNSNLPAVTVSCGVAVILAAVEPIVALGKAGPALQAAKNLGGNRVVVATETDRNGHNGHNDHNDNVSESTACRAALAVAVASLEARDRATAAHSDDVVTLCESLGTRLGLSDVQLDRLTAAAQLHDVGKLAMPTEILNKPGSLNDQEWDIIREHTVIGERMLRAVPEMGAVANVVRHSHERWDGSGYPDGLAGEEIPLASRIILCADAFHAIRSDRPYRPGRSADEALAEVRRYAGEQFDPRVVDALAAVARDVRRAGKGIAVPRSRRLAALLAALAVCGGGSAYAASEDVRHVVGEVVKAVGPGTVLEAAEAEAGSPDFALRPIGEVPDIVPVSILTPDLELAPFKDIPSYQGTAQSDIGIPVVQLIEAPAPAEGVAPALEESNPQASWPISMEPVQPTPLLTMPAVLAVPPTSTAPTLIPVENVAREPDGGAQEDNGNPHGEPPAVGNPHGEPPGQDKETQPEQGENPHGTPPGHDDEVIDDIVEELPPVADELPPLVDDLPEVDDPPIEEVAEELPPVTAELPPLVDVDTVEHQPPHPHSDDAPEPPQAPDEEQVVPTPALKQADVPAPNVKEERDRPDQPTPADKEERNPTPAAADSVFTPGKSGEAPRESGSAQTAETIGLPPQSQRPPHPATE